MGPGRKRNFPPGVRLTEQVNQCSNRNEEERRSDNEAGSRIDYPDERRHEAIKRSHDGSLVLGLDGVAAIFCALLIRKESGL
jgi:hypothetical protein